MPKRKPYPSDVTDEEWPFVAPYLTLVREEAPQRRHDLREVFDPLRWILRSGAPWRMLPHDFPSWEAVYQQTQRWITAGVFEAMVHDLRALLCLAQGRASDPTAAVLDSRTLRSTPESGHRAGYDGAKRKKGSKLHAAVDTLGHLLALWVGPANEQDRTQVEALAEAVQEATGESVELAYVDRGYAGEQPAEQAEAHGIRLEVVKHPGSKKGFVLLAADGSWSAPSRGRRAFGAWSRITNCCRRPWRDCTSSLSRAWYSPAPYSPSALVHNAL
jgi:transposase